MTGGPGDRPEKLVGWVSQGQTAAMKVRNQQNVVGGAILMILGIFVAAYSIINYRQGTLQHMGAGLFPSSLGVILAILGAIILVMGLRQPGQPLRIELGPVVAVFASLIAFAVTVPTLGLVPAVVVLALISSRADNKLGLIGACALAAALSLLSVAVFSFALGVPLRLFRSPF